MTLKASFAAGLLLAGLFAAPIALAGDCPQSKARQTAGMGHGAARTAGDIVETAAAAGQFRTLLAAAEAAGLVATLKSEGPFTIFAPTDAAFAGLPRGTVENLLKPENKAQLVKVLTYHVVPGRILAADLAGKTAHPKTVQGQTLRVDGRQGVTIDNAEVVEADIRADNGVIHVIDKVLLPK
jgi:uncharacterized surface protein with fasciclin (FAS1) repeats